MSAVSKKSLARGLGFSAIIWLLLYGVFRIYTIWYSLGLDVHWINKVVILLFAAAEGFVLIHALGYFADIIRSLSAYRRPTIRYGQEQPPITVLVTAYGEPVSILRKTLIAISFMDYQNFQTVLLDDSEDSTKVERNRDLCKELNVAYVHRQKRRAAKAGALNDYLPKISSPYMVIFDADFRPGRDFLKLLAPQMEADPKLGFIQTPQFYSNLTSSKVATTAQMVQSTFFEYICEGKGDKGAMFMCGTNLIIRTSALRQVGGFVETSITEDFATTIELFKAGYKSKYYNFAVAFGEGPPTLEEYFKQQYRWARGTLGVFFKNLRLLIGWDSPLRWWQKIEMSLSGIYYGIGVAWIILIIIPVLYLIFSIPVYFSQPEFYFAAYAPYFVLSSTFFVQTLILRRYLMDNLVKSQSLNVLTLPIYARAAWDTVRGKKTVFQTVLKDEAHGQPFSWGSLKFQLALAAVNIVGIIFGLYRLASSGGPAAALLINIFWASYHLFLILYLPITLRSKKLKYARAQ